MGLQAIKSSDGLVSYRARIIAQTHALCGSVGILIRCSGPWFHPRSRLFRSAMNCGVVTSASPCTPLSPLDATLYVAAGGHYDFLFPPWSWLTKGHPMVGLTLWPTSPRFASNCHIFAYNRAITVLFIRLSVRRVNPIHRDELLSHPYRTH